MKIKPGVILAGLQLPMRLVLMEANRIWSELGQELAITSGLDGTHSPGSMHYYGYALDMRTRYFADGGREACSRLRSALPAAYFVQLESNHIHVSYQFEYTER
jgi:hypothetical protein